MLASERPDARDRAMAIDAGFDAPSSSFVRHGYVPSASNRLFGVAGTTIIFLVIATGLFVSFQTFLPPPSASAPLVVTLLPVASPPETPPRPKVALTPIEKHEPKPTPPKVEPIKDAIVPLPSIPAPQPVQAAKQPDPAPPQPETAAPRTAPAPPAPQVSNNAPDTWEGRVLARLQKFQRYPGSARSARQQGVVYIRFRIDRDGHVLSSSLLRSSGFPALDQAALDTLRRADPLPKIPPERPDEIELEVPVEFYMH